MMKFNFITPETRDKHREEMRSYFTQMAKVWGEISLDRHDTQSANYVVCHHPEHGVIGGLRLLPTLGPKLADDSLNDTGISLQDDQTWELSKLFFCLPFDDSSEGSEKYEKICTEFYSSLWEYLQEVCHVDMLVTILPETEHEDASYFGEWPFALESPISNPFDPEEPDYILGVLRLGESDKLAMAG